MKTKLIYTFLILLFVLSGITLLEGQEVIVMDEVLEAVVDNSYASVAAKNTKAIAQANFDFFGAQLKPSLSLRANLPDYSKTFSPIVQPDGTVSFTSIRQANSSLSLSASQVLQSTGGTVFLSTALQRFDDFSFKAHQYNGIPIRLGISQPLFGFNPWKYDKEIQSLELKEAELRYSLEMEESLSIATDMYFNILIAKQNLEIARTNESVNEKLLSITDERLKLGKVSKDERLQLEIELNNAKLSVSQANYNVQLSISELYTYIGKAIPDASAEFIEPSILQRSFIDPEVLISHHKKNRPEYLAQLKDKKNNARELAKRKAEYGFQAEIQASIGLARGAAVVSDVYTDPFDEQRFNVSLVVPVLDFGRKKSALKQVEILENDIDARYEQQFMELENNIRQRVYLYTRLQSEIALLQEIMEKADERFTISNERYVLGNIDITNLTLAQREKDQTRRNYINTLKAYWVNYYELRKLSGYDIVTDQKIIY